jgi:S1-C subfamily serine protease
MNTYSYFLKTLVASVLILAPLVALASPPDTTLLDTKRSGGDFPDFYRGIPTDWRGSGAELPRVITVVTNPSGGIGLLIGEAQGGVAVKRVVTGTPAWQAGVREGDLIVAIDSQPTGESRLHDIALRLRGQIGSEVDLTLSRTGQAQTFKVKLRREEVKPPADGFRL